MSKKFKLFLFLFSLLAFVVCCILFAVLNSVTAKIVSFILSTVFFIIFVLILFLSINKDEKKNRFFLFLYAIIAYTALLLGFLRSFDIQSAISNTIFYICMVAMGIIGVATFFNEYS